LKSQLNEFQKKLDRKTKKLSKQSKADVYQDTEQSFVQSKQGGALSARSNKKVNSSAKRVLATQEDSQRSGGELLDLETANVQQVVKAGDKLQDKSKEALNRIKSKNADIEQIGVETTAELRRQNEKLMILDEKLNEIESLNKRTDKYVRNLGKALINDKLHLYLSIGIVINLIVLIVIVAEGWDDLFPEK
jgi:hypothetical protein